MYIIVLFSFPIWTEKRERILHADKCAAGLQKKPITATSLTSEYANLFGYAPYSVKNSVCVRLLLLCCVHIVPHDMEKCK